MEDYQQMEAVNNRIITLRGQQVIIDRDVAELYGVATKRVNEALKTTPTNFPKVMLLRYKATKSSNWSKISTGSTA